MITPDYVRMMARYNAWQNVQIMRVVDTMSMEELSKDQGAFFGSIWGTLNHLLWGDQMWMSRFTSAQDAPGGTIEESVSLTPNVSVWNAERFKTDGHITTWASRMTQIDLAGKQTWYSGAAGREMSRPQTECIAHMFNHQTHHRGQIHAMLSASGKTPPVSDILLMPED